MMKSSELDRRPIIVAITGPNGAGKTTFFHSHLARTGLRFVNADVLGASSQEDPRPAAGLGDAHLIAVRQQMRHRSLPGGIYGKVVGIMKRPSGTDP